MPMMGNVLGLDGVGANPALSGVGLLVSFGWVGATGLQGDLVMDWALIVMSGVFPMWKV